MRIMKKNLYLLACVAMLSWVCASCTSNDPDEPSATEQTTNPGTGSGSGSGTSTGTAVTYVDLGLPSGNKWNKTPEEGFYSYSDAVSTFGSKLPSKDDWQELLDECDVEYFVGYIEFVATNGNRLRIPGLGYIGAFSAGTGSEANCAIYWSSTYISEGSMSERNTAWTLHASTTGNNYICTLNNHDPSWECSVLLLQ